MAKKIRNVHLWIQGADLDRLESYRASLPIVPAMTETVRHLVSLGLKAEMAKKPSPAKDKAA